MAADDMTAQAMTGAGVNYVLSAEIIRALKTGKTTTPVTLMSMGLSGPLAIEMAKQVNARVATRRYMYGLGLPQRAADAIAVAITAGVV